MALRIRILLFFGPWLLGDIRFLYSSCGTYQRTARSAPGYVLREKGEPNKCDKDDRTEKGEGKRRKRRKSLSLHRRSSNNPWLVVFPKASHFFQEQIGRQVLICTVGRQRTLYHIQQERYRTPEETDQETGQKLKH